MPRYCWTLQLRCGCSADRLAADSNFRLICASTLQVIHEGVDVDQLRTLRVHRPARPSCLPLDQEVEVVTYVSRGFEEYRGFPQAMQAIADLQRQRPKLHALVVGADVVAYGRARSDGRSWQDWAQQDLGLDPERTHWLGSLQTDDYQAVLAWSRRASVPHHSFCLELELARGNGGWLCRCGQCNATS